MDLNDISSITKHGIDELTHYYSGNICWSIDDYSILLSNVIGLDTMEIIKEFIQ